MFCFFFREAKPAQVLLHFIADSELIQNEQHVQQRADIHDSMEPDSLKMIINILKNCNCVQLYRCWFVRYKSHSDVNKLLFFRLLIFHTVGRVTFSLKLTI